MNQSDLNAALQVHQAGNLAHAEKLYRQILRVDPRNADAQNLLGVVAYQSGNHAVAASCIREALRLRPQTPLYHCNLGAALQALGDFQGAVAEYRAALTQRPEFAQAQFNLGVAYASAGEIPLATAAYRETLRIETGHIHANMNLGNILLANGQRAEAEAHFRRVLEIDPANISALYNFGNALFSQDQFEQARGAFQRVLQLNPRHAAAAFNLARTYEILGQIELAAESYRHTLQLTPGDLRCAVSLGKILQSQSQFEAALAVYHQALGHQPASIEMLCAAGNAHRALAERTPFPKNLERAVTYYRRVLEIDPHHIETLNNLGSTLQLLGQVPEAIVHFRTALRVGSDRPEVYFNLGIVLRSQQESEEAEGCFRVAIRLDPMSVEAHHNLGNVLLAREDCQAAIESFRETVRLDPGHYHAHNNLGVAYNRLQRAAEAIASFQAALALKPDLAEAHNNLGTVYRLIGLNREAANCFRKAIALGPDLADAHNNLGAALYSECRLDEAIDSYREALRLQPDLAHAHSNLLLVLNYHPEFDPDEMFREHCRWGARHGQPEDVLPPPSNAPDPARKLRIGYVSPDFRAHAMAHFLEPILAYHDPRQVEVFAYAEVSAPDAITTQFQQQVAHWKNTCGQSDREVAEQIRRDGIDVLVDLAGHTAQNRLQVFGWNPAPVQVTGLGYGTTTGLSSIQYRLTDAVADPAGEPIRHTEELVRLPQGVYCYQPPEHAPAVAGLPAQQNGFVTFGSFNNLAKLTPPTISLWSDVLHAVSGSRLLLKHRSFEDRYTRERFLQQFTARGITGERLEFAPQVASLAGHLEVYGRVDIALDPTPYTGLTTTFEALWMGVPVITLRGTSFVGRLSASMLTYAGFPELIAETASDYVTLAAQLAGDIAGLAQRRPNWRPQLATSPACDAAGYTRHLEAAYRRMWEDWCRQRVDGTEGRTPSYRTEVERGERAA